MSNFSFRQYLEQNTVGTHNDGPGGPFSRFGGAYLTTDQTGSEGIDTLGMTGRPGHLPGYDLTNIPSAVEKIRIPSLDFPVPNDVPLMKIKSEVAVVNRNKNPIFVQLKDGTRFFLSRDQYDRFGKPSVGMSVTAELQRHPTDKSDVPSQVHSIKIG